MDRQEVQAFIEASVKAAVEEALAQFGNQISRQGLREMVPEAVTEGASDPNQVDDSELGSKSESESKAGGPTPITKAEVAQLIQAEIALLLPELGPTSAQAAKVGKPTPTPIIFSTPTTTPALIRASTPTPSSTPAPEFTPNQIVRLRLLAGVYELHQGRITAQDLSKETGIDEVRSRLFLEEMVDRGVAARFGTPPNVYYERAH